MTLHAYYLIFKQMNIIDNAIHIIKKPAPVNAGMKSVKGQIKSHGHCLEDFSISMPLDFGGDIK